MKCVGLDVFDGVLILSISDGIRIIQSTIGAHLRQTK